MPSTLARLVHCELLVRKSRFVGCVQVVAGRPMLEVLRHQDLDGALATVVRYFGGVKLGAGGLVRRERQAAGAVLGAVRHGDAVEIAFGIAVDAAVALRARLNEAGQGALQWSWAGLRAAHPSAGVAARAQPTKARGTPARRRARAPSRH